MVEIRGKVQRVVIAAAANGGRIIAGDFVVANNGETGVARVAVDAATRIDEHRRLAGRLIGELSLAGASGRGQLGGNVGAIEMHFVIASAAAASVLCAKVE